MEISNTGWRTRLTHFTQKLRNIFLKLTRDRLVLVGLIILTAVVAVSIFAPLIAPHDPTKIHIAPPGKSLPLEPFVSARNGDFMVLGTDQFGRCILSRLMYGGRVTLVIAVLGIGFALLAGALLGGLAGYLQGSIVDEILMRISDAIMTIPGTIVALVVVAAFGYGKIKIGFLALPPGTIIVFALMFAITPRLFRTMRASIISQMQEEYVLSAKAMGMSNLRIILVELLPNSLSPLLIQGMLYMGTAVFMTAALGYLGFGPPDPTPEWGKILSHTQSYFLRRRFWNLLVPGFYIGLIIFSFTILGDGLRNLLDPEFGHEKPSRISRILPRPNND